MDQRRVFAVILILLSFPLLAMAQTYIVTDIESVIPWAINNQGVIAGSDQGGSRTCWQ